jgi:hypothetical protein
MDEKIFERLRQEIAEHISIRKTACTRATLTAEVVNALSEAGGPSAKRLPNLRNSIVRALRRERGKARSGSPSYSFNRHIALHQTLKALLNADRSTI